MQKQQDIDFEMGVEVAEEKTVTSSTGHFASSEDPFAQRDGKTLLWRNVNMVLVRKKE